MSGTTWAKKFDRDRSNYDRRLSMPEITNLNIPAKKPQKDAIIRLKKLLRGALVERFSKKTGATRTLSNPVGYLTEPKPGDPGDIALDFVRSNLELLGLDPTDLDEFEITDTVHSTTTGSTQIYLRQKFLEVPVNNAQLQINVNRDGRIVSVNNAFIPNIIDSAGSAEPAITALEALSSAALHLEVQMDSGAKATDAPFGPQQVTPLSAEHLSLQPIKAELMWLPMGRKLKLVWRFQIYTMDEQHVYDLTVDAEAGATTVDGGRVFTRFDWVTQDSYNVYPIPAESPNHTSGRSLVEDPEETQLASPNGWHDTGGTSFSGLRGNNVHAYHDQDNNNAPPGVEPTCNSDGGSLVCDFSLNLSQDPTNYTDAAVANLFYWNNTIHDIQYLYGFDEQAGNFQVNNFGRGGQGGDDVRAEAQDGGGINNANFLTPGDGSRPRMQMYLWNQSNPLRDGDLDNGIVVHEYGHGISIRQVGGPSNVGCLGNAQQPGEGWSDWFALVYTAQQGDQATDARGIGTYALGQPTTGSGIRTQRYSTDPGINTHTYASISGMAIPHGVGEVWAQGLWEVYWALVDKHGFDPNLYNTVAAAGNHRALLYVNEGLKNTACSPTFTEARDGIIQAAIDNFGGEDVCTIWSAFANFGLGVDAVSGGSNSTNPTNGFSLPASCIPPPPAPVCDAGSIDFNSFGLEPYSNQDVTGSVTVENNGDTLLMEGNRWQRSTQTFDVTSDTMLAFQFLSSSQGEIHGIGFDEDQTLTNNLRLSQFWGTQNWTGAIPFTPRYSGSGNYENFTIPIGQSYTGTGMRLVFVNDKDAGALNNNGRFACVQVLGGTPPPL
ncbi:MAG: M36 family metallopeptidase, partial [Nitrospirota bacterium]|nr:M36 family metallopeptidase [Nitrospirota bacterium]